MNAKARPTKLASHLFMSILATLMFLAFAVPGEVHAKNDTRALPALEQFIDTVTDGNPETLRGVYVPQVMALPVVQQPGGDSRFVSRNDVTATQFNMAAREGNVGLLAHNYLAGDLFFNIEQGDQVILVYGNRRTETFVVENILKYQALPRGGYRELDTQNILGIGGLFNEVYGGDYHVALQTCIEKNGDANWGRLFVIARPALPIVDEEDLEAESVLSTAAASQTLKILGWPLASFRPNLGTVGAGETRPLY